MRITRATLYIAIAITASIFVASASYLYVRLSDKPAAAIGGSYQLTDQFGKKRQSKEFIGRPQVVYFGYTFCPDVCPIGLQTIAEALDLLGDDGKKVQPVFITVDPARDTSAILKDYLMNFGPQFVGLTGSDADVRRVLSLFKVYAKIGRRDEKDPSVYLVDHTSFMYVMGSDGAYRFFIPHGKTAEEVAAVIKKVL